MDPRTLRPAIPVVAVAKPPHPLRTRENPNTAPALDRRCTRQGFLRRNNPALADIVSSPSVVNPAYLASFPAFPYIRDSYAKTLCSEEPARHCVAGMRLGQCSSALDARVSR
ncbi:uncharacterized protein DSM5745_09474 [Aspergillus mulundensis]|uniref:Uncharacterized protein n=1 Tax=Aspergillus mulundensis TaxID=1810919 RepID=A0A3D8QVE2_9EURO|nr:hypothetical protein DSM5745_09474 [Aspergillus mulundensis]RDW65735.1 hypothetical protein DSM5745_09474 [Aspergillus mulundensis]